MTIRILSTSPLVGPALQRLGAACPEVSIAPYRSIAWKMSLASAEALVVMLSEPITEADLLPPGLQLPPRGDVVRQRRAGSPGSGGRPGRRRAAWA